MEPPAHNEFQPARLEDSQKQKAARSALQKLAKFIRDQIKRVALQETEDESELDELAQYFDITDHELTDQAQKEGDLNSSIVVRSRPTPIRKVNMPEIRFITGSDVERGGRSGAGGASGEAPQDKEPTQRDQAEQQQLVDIRAIHDGPREKRILFTPVESAKVKVGVLAIGADETTTLAVESARHGGRNLKVRGYEIGLIELRAGERCRLDIVLKEAFAGPLLPMASKSSKI